LSRFDVSQVAFNDKLTALSDRWCSFYKLMLRDGESYKAFDRFFVPIGTVDISAAIYRRVAKPCCRVL